MGAANKVIAGDHQGKAFINSNKGIILCLSITKRIVLNKDTVEDYEVVGEEKRTSGVSAVGRGLVGSFLLGPVGLLAGLTAKKKGVHVVAIQFRDGAKSLIEIDEKLYKTLVTTLF